MSAFAIIGIILAFLAGIINLGVGVMRRNRPMLMVMRLGIGILSIAAAIAIIVLKMDDVSFASVGITGVSKTIYLIMGLAIFVGATLMLPASVERNNLPKEEQMRPTMRPSSVAHGESGIRVMQEDWMN